MDQPVSGEEVAALLAVLEKNIAQLGDEAERGELRAELQAILEEIREIVTNTQ